MNSAAFKRDVSARLLANGFARVGKSFQRRHDDVATVLGFDKSHFANDWGLKVGFWLFRIGGQSVPNKVEHTHLYFPLERLFPQFREILLIAGALDDPQQSVFFNQLITLLDTAILPGLETLATESGLRQGLLDGRLANGLVWKDARAFLIGH